MRLPARMGPWLLLVFLSLLGYAFVRGNRRPTAAVGAFHSATSFQWGHAHATLSNATGALVFRGPWGSKDIALAVRPIIHRPDDAERRERGETLPWLPGPAVPLSARAAVFTRVSPQELRLRVAQGKGSGDAAATEIPDAVLILRQDDKSLVLSLEPSADWELLATFEDGTKEPENSPNPSTDEEHSSHEHTLEKDGNAAEDEPQAAPETPEATKDPVATQLVPKVKFLQAQKALGVAGLFEERVISHDQGSRVQTVQLIARGPLTFALSDKSGEQYGPLLRAAGESPHIVRGSVFGASADTRLYGLDAEGHNQVDSAVEASGAFSIEASKQVVDWYAADGHGLKSAVAHFVPGESPGELNLDLAPGGTLAVKVVDAESGLPLIARIVIRGTDGTTDPNFGPDFRGSGAGPLMDTRDGAFATDIAKGRYRVLATKGLEYSIDEQTVEIGVGTHAQVTLKPRHVLSMPSLIGCDLHVHARPSFDTLVSIEDRIVSLVAAGIDFAVPTEHNIVGDYGPALSYFKLERELAFIPGVETTTFAPKFGHFGVFPWPIEAKVPPYRETSPSKLFNAVHADGDPNRFFQVNHPRMQNQIGYFELMHLDALSGAREPRARMDFDAIEVMNGYEMLEASTPERVLRDYMNLLNLGKRYIATGSSDSHRILYGWAGYPRTFVHLENAAASKVLDPLAVIRALKAGHATVSSGPVIELTVEGVSPGDTVPKRTDAIARTALKAHVRVLAVPWVDARTLEIVVNGRAIIRRELPPRELRTGPELGTPEEVRARMVRFDQDLEIPTSEADTWVIAVTRGTQKLDTYLPSTPYLPVAFTNPIWLVPKREPARDRKLTPAAAQPSQLAPARTPPPP
jgi:hypothetical protein